MAKWQGFYSTSQVSRLAGVPTRTLYDWRERKIIAPSVQIIGDAGKVDEGYSYADLAIIKLLRGLRNKQLNLPSVAIALRHLFERFGSPDKTEWQKAHIYVEDKTVFAKKPDEWDVTVATDYGQKAMTELLAADLFEEEATLLVPKSFTEYVEINPDVMEGIPVIRNTRIPTSMVAMMVGQATSLSELGQLYQLPRSTLRRAIEFEQTLDKATSLASA